MKNPSSCFAPVSKVTKSWSSICSIFFSLCLFPSDDLNQYRKDRANKLIKSHSTHIQQLSTEITKLAPKLATPISSVPYNAELARELGFSTDPPPAGNGGDDDDDTPEPRRFPESSPSNGNDLDANPWSREALSDQSSYPSRPFHIEDDRSSASSLLQHIHHFDTNPSTTRHSRSVVWESDADVKDCRRCNKRFGLLNRRHHCRRCGLIVCVKCSSSRAILAASEIIRNPNEMVADHVLEAQYHRICDKCYADLGINA
ncbi:FYVE-domain-containing protein [Hesseltinella vesiculosa]|uniref:FYVE-domain-containing protein n=1 Tax=Hesseltinella vesiculosa TaxID=101127 RepID=A0A1X2GQQ6_9FUNG|nr:FYVE-domain-containing protein [Hesseltinella vesiculosa]